MIAALSSSAKNFAQLYSNVDCAHTHSATVSHFLEEHPSQYGRTAMRLDHRGWLAWHEPEVLHEA